MKVVRKEGPGANTLKHLLQSLDGKQGQVGWFESAKYEDGTPAAYVAAIHEYGYPEGNIPARPHMRPTIKRELKNLKNIVRAGVFDIILRGASIGKVMEGLTSYMAGQWRKTIATITTPPLADETVEARKRARANKKKLGNLDKPLVDTRYMIDTLNHEVVDK